MSDNKILLEWRDDVAILTLNDPASLNAVTIPMIESIDRALDAVEGRARTLILTGAGRAFCSGANIGVGMSGEVGNPETYDAGEVLGTHINPLMVRFRRLPMPWISVVRGAAAGVGASLALAADMVVASETAFFLQAFARLGLVPDGSSSHLLVKTIGRPRAMELMLLGDRLPARQALEWGLINRVTPDADLNTLGLELATRLASGARSLGFIRDLGWLAVDSDLEACMAAEHRLQTRAGHTADHVEGVAAFMGKRSAQFAGA